MSTHPWLVLHLRKDAEAFARAPFPVGTIVCLTPSAYHAVVAAGHDARRAGDTYGDWGHRRALVRMRRTERYLLQRFGAEDLLHAASQESLRQCLTTLAAVSSRLDRLMRSLDHAGPWCVIDADGPRSLDSVPRLQEYLLGKFTGQMFFADDARARTPVWGRWVQNGLNALSASVAGRRPSVVLVKLGRGMMPLAKTIMAAGNRASVISFGFSKHQTRSYRQAAANVVAAVRAMRRPEAQPPIVYGVPLRPVTPALRARLLDYLRGIPDPVVRRDAQALAGHIVAFVGSMHGASFDLERLLGRLKPRSVAIWVIGGGLGPALARAAQRVGRPTWLMPATSISGADRTATARYAAGLFTRTIGTSPLVTGMIAQSGASELASRDVEPRQKVIRSRPLIWPSVYTPAGKTSSRGPGRVVLLLGNFGSWHDEQPWVKETADEFAHSVRLLAEATAAVPNCRLVIRSKSKPELDFDAMSDLVRNHAHCEVQASRDILGDRSVPPLQEALAEADLAAGFSTTAIEEALYAHCPVLLWGGNQRYAHLRARLTPPTPADRAAVYGLGPDQAAPPMISAILDVHAGTRLSDAEIAEYCWDASYPSYDEAARLLLDDPASQTCRGHAI